MKNELSEIKSFLLKAVKISEDFPVWDGGGLTVDMEDEIVEMEDAGEIEEYTDEFPNVEGHKLGGYPSFNQSGIEFGEGFEFVLQIASDEKAGLNFIDNGTVFLAYNQKAGDWKFYCDFF